MEADERRRWQTCVLVEVTCLDRAAVRLRQKGWRADT